MGTRLFLNINAVFSKRYQLYNHAFFHACHNPTVPIEQTHTRVLSRLQYTSPPHALYALKNMDFYVESRMGAYVAGSLAHKEDGPIYQNSART